MLGLGEEYHRRHATSVLLWRRHRELGAITDVAAQAAIDAPRRHVGEREFSTGEYMAAHAAASAATGSDAAAAANDAAIQFMDEAAEQIRAMPAATPAGLLVKTRVLMYRKAPPYNADLENQICRVAYAVRLVRLALGDMHGTVGENALHLAVELMKQEAEAGGEMYQAMHRGRRP